MNIPPGMMPIANIPALNGPDGRTLSPPLPSPSTVAAPGWFSPKVSPGWTGVAAGNTNSGSTARTLVWGTPVFDLRPEFLGRPAATSQPQDAGQEPIWRPYGSGGRLFVNFEVTAATAITLRGINITALIMGSPWDPRNLRVLVPEQDVTSDLLSTNTPRQIASAGVPVVGVEAQAVTGGMCVWTPPGGSDGPIRFWHLKLIVRNWIVTVGDPTIEITAGYY